MAEQDSTQPDAEHEELASIAAFSSTLGTDPTRKASRASSPQRPSTLLGLLRGPPLKPER